MVAAGAVDQRASGERGTGLSEVAEAERVVEVERRKIAAAGSEHEPDAEWVVRAIVEPACELPLSPTLGLRLKLSLSPAVRYRLF